MGNKPQSPFDRFIGSYYGGAPLDLDPSRRARDLLSDYYGTPSAAADSPRAQSFSLGHDDGEVLPQRCQKARADAGQSVAQSQSTDAEDIEYVVGSCAPAKGPGDGSATVGASPAPTASQPNGGGSSNPPAPVASQSSLSTQASEDDFMGDLKSIMRGEKAYDKQKGMVDRASFNGGDNGGAAKASAPVSTGQGAHKIFDRIAQSMQYANAYDLGSVELENRFAEFDRQEDAKKRGTNARKQAKERAEVPEKRTSVDRPGEADFISDLDTMRSRPPAKEQPAFASSLSLELAARSEKDLPFYDTGEHVLLGGDEYAGRLHIGAAPGVGFSYGQLVAMGDLYATPKEMFEASVAELTRLKALIVSDTNYYSGKKANKDLGVKDKTWDEETGGRFLKLAEDNYEHFSPAHVAMGAASRTAHGDNKSQWERYHQKAIEEAQKAYLASSGNTSLFLERPLVINAFADHFLTDAFAAGHTINKDVMLDRFTTNFFKKPKSLNDAGEEFFKRVAKEAWWGMVSYKFSKLETAEGQIHIPFIGNVYHPDIDSAEMFAKVLMKAAEEEPTRVGNLLVKALHDRLNDDGVEVTNQAGDGTWYIPGDGSLMVGKGRLTPANLTKNFGIIRKAVQQSVNDINNPEIRASNLDVNKFFNGVWRYVPQLTAVGQSQVSAMIKEYSDPHSAILTKAAADLIHDQLDTMLNIMVKKEHKLQPN